jgi:RimJ/RimL family protein N-acetyltransferase
MFVHTPRLILVAATPELARAEVDDRARFAELLDAEVPASWPPETLADALPFFLGLLEANPEWAGWLGWYAIGREAAGKPRRLVGSVGFKGPPTDTGDVEIGYSVLPQCQGRGYASEMVRGLCGWAFGHRSVRRVLAETTADNVASLRVLRKLDFAETGPGSEAGSVQFALPRSAAG